MVISFKSLEVFDYAIHSFKPLAKQINNLTSIYSQENNSQIPNSKFLDSQLLNIKDSNRIVRLSSDSEVIDLLMELLNGRKLLSLTDHERSQIINKLRKEKKVTKRQISSIMRIKQYKKAAGSNRCLRR